LALLISENRDDKTNDLSHQAAIGPDNKKWYGYPDDPLNIINWNPDITSHALQMLFTEMWVTWVFLSVIMGVKYCNGAKDLQVNAFMIGLTLSG